MRSLERLVRHQLLRVHPPLWKTGGYNPFASARDLQHEKFILMQDGHCLGAQVQQFCETKGFRPEISCRSAQIGTVLAMVQAGLGISLIPEMALPGAAKNGIVYRSLDGVRPRRVLTLALPGQRKPSLCVTEFIKFVRAHRAPLRGDSGTASR